MGVPVTLDEFATYLNDPAVAVDTTGRATLILGFAQTLCETIVTPLPATADIVILDVAQRAYANPTGVRNASLGLYAEDQGPYSDGTPGVSGGGLWLTDGNRQTLRELNAAASGAQTSSAFSVDMTPAGAMSDVSCWADGSSWDGWV